MTALADAYDAFLFDLDGVLYRGTEVVPGAPEAVARLRVAGKRMAFVTNNSGRTPETVAADLTALGIRAGAEEVVTSALVTAERLAARGVSEAFVVGEEGILRALRDVGIAIADTDADRTQVVVVGWDRRADYEKLRRASLLVERGAVLVATNADASYPAVDGNWPGAGALLAAVETTTGTRAEVFGKPNAPIMQGALDRAGGGRPLVIGDRLDTDIAAAVGLGWDSLLVLTGISRLDDVAASPISPAFVAEDLSGLFAPTSVVRGPRNAGYAGAGVARATEGDPMTTLEEVRKTIEAVIGNLTPAKAQELAKGLSDPGTAKDHVSKMAADMLEWSQRSRDRLKDVISREVASQMKSMGVATQADLDAVKKRVRDLERRAGMTASGRGATAKKATAKRATSQKPTGRKPTGQTAGQTAAKKTATEKTTVKPAANVAS